MTYQTKLSEAERILNVYNERAPESKKVTWEDFHTKLIEAGGASEDALARAKWEDLEKMGLPPLVARQIGDVFRKKDGDEEKKTVVSTKKAEGMTVRQLLEVYDPRDVTNAVGNRLRVLSGGKRCLVFTDAGKLDVEASTTLFDEIRDDYPEREYYTVDGRPQPTYRVGQRPGRVADENPLYASRMLRPDGTCDQTNRSWSGVSHEVRVLVSLAKNRTGEISNTFDSAHNAIDLALSENAATKLRSRCPKASVLYDQLVETGSLPTLKIPRGENVSVRQQQDPFHTGGNRTT